MPSMKELEEAMRTHKERGYLTMPEYRPMRTFLIVVRDERYLLMASPGWGNPEGLEKAAESIRQTLWQGGCMEIPAGLYLQPLSPNMPPIFPVSTTTPSTPSPLSAPCSGSGD